MACRDDRYARPIVEAASLFDLPLLGLPGSRLEILSQGRFVIERQGRSGCHQRGPSREISAAEPPSTQLGSMIALE